MNGAPKSEQAAADHKQASHGDPAPRYAGITSGHSNSPDVHSEPKQEGDHVELGSWPDWVVVVFTLVLTVVAVMQHRLEAKMGAETADALTIARISAEAARKSADVAEQSLHISQRAYVYPRGFDTLMACDVPQNIYFALVKCEFSNDGATPANNLRVQITRSRDRNNFKSVPVSGGPTVNLGPRKTFDTIYMRVEFGQLCDIYDGKNEQFVFARVDYDDVFGLSHYAEYCVQMHVLSDPRLIVTDGGWIEGARSAIGYTVTEDFNSGD